MKTITYRSLIAALTQFCSPSAFAQDKAEKTELSAEQMCPQFHYTAKKGWINDPVGLFYFDGEYHLFNDHNVNSTKFPGGTTSGDQSHWAHAISKDLIHWQHMPVTSGPKHTKPISRGSWLIEVIFNDPPPPPPNDVPALDEGAGDPNETIREKFAKHREDVNCASCHARIDPLGFALENYNPVGQWREHYENKRKVDASGRLLKTYDFKDVTQFKTALVQEDKHMARAFTGHLFRYALSRELSPKDWLEVDTIVAKTEDRNYPVRSVVREVLLSDGFLSKSFSADEN